MDNDICGDLYSVTWQQGIIYPEQLEAVESALKQLFPNKFPTEPTMQPGETARHLNRILKGEVWKPGYFWLIAEQKEALEFAVKELYQEEDNQLDYEKGKYD